MDPKTFTIAALVALAALPGSAAAQAASGHLLASGAPQSADHLHAGEQLLLDQTTATFAFAGQELSLEQFTGVLGFSAETAYVLVIDGNAAIGSQRAGSGRILVIHPQGARPAVASYDAARFAQQWSQTAADSHAGAHARLQAIAARQGRGLFLGRLGRTALNLSAPSGARAEAARRSVVGDPAVMAIRYSGAEDYAAIGRSVSERMVAALAQGDAASVAALLDPVPYGNTDLTGGGGDARLLTANAILARNDWQAALRGAVLAPGDSPASWIATSPAASAQIALRRMGDFVFVSSIELGEAQ